MAQMIPSIVKDFHGSGGEERVFQALRKLPDHITVIHSFRWLHPGQSRGFTARTAAQGEGDFVLFDPTNGVMVVEVKGGDVWCSHGEWLQKNRQTGAIKEIYPEEQASATVHRLREEVHARVPSAKSLLFCHGVWFPDGVTDRANLPMNCPSEIVLDEDDVANPALGIARAFAYWHKAIPGRTGLSPKDARNVLDILAPTLSFVPSIRRSLDDREAQLVQLTREQVRVIDFLDEQPQAAIHGAAGTGKTLVAVEKARRVASASEPVLFLCYNTALKAHLEAHHAHPNVRYATFHGLAHEVVGPANSYDDAEQALLAHLIDEKPIGYSHLIVDEGQDFKTEWLEFLSLRFRDSSFYVFYDRHQFVQGDDLKWLEAMPCRLVLTRNCRNTDPIARAAYRAAKLSISPTLGVGGPRPFLHCVESPAQAIALTQTLLDAAIGNVRSQPHDLAVLTLETHTPDSPLFRVQSGGKPVSPDPTVGRVTATTARRFKGLEASLVIVPDVDFRLARDADWCRRLYVACSRARQALHLITFNQESDLDPAVKAFSDSEKARPTWRALARQLGLQLAQGAFDDPFQG